MLSLSFFLRPVFAPGVEFVREFFVSFPTPAFVIGIQTAQLLISPLPIISVLSTALMIGGSRKIAVLRRTAHIAVGALTIAIIACQWASALAELVVDVAVISVLMNSTTLL